MASDGLAAGQGEDLLSPDVDPVSGEPTAQASDDHSPLKDELASLVEDGKTYAEAELAFQKTRLSFAADRGKSVVVLALLALGFVHLMLIGLVVGSIFALAQTMNGWLATAIVFGALLIATIICALIIRAKVKDVTNAFKKPDA